MIITYLGKQFFKIQQGDIILAFNPISKNSKTVSKISRFGSTIAFSTINHPDYNGFEMVGHGDTLPFEVHGPGDYEIKDIFIKGIMNEVTVGGKKYINTIYSLSVDGISICFLGCVLDGKLSVEVRGQIGSPDILFVPVGNDDLLTQKESYKLAVSLEPKIIIPMEYNKETLKTFLKEAGQEGLAPIEKLTIKAKDIVSYEGKVVVLLS